MGRLAWYAGVSSGLAAGVVVSAFHQHPNFYSACVYLAQSNLCLMILINLILLVYAACVYGLQRLCFGPLRPIEVEQLYEKAWFAVTETCLAMTIFREEVGAWFLVMFVALLTGKVWGWIGDGRIEVLEQQPPANPGLAYTRLGASLLASLAYDGWLLFYTLAMVYEEARPSMMVMFLFEFAVLTVCSLSTSARFLVTLIEASMVRKQTHDRLAERKREVREERAAAIQQREAARVRGEEPSAGPLPSEEDVDEMDIEVPGWEEKGQAILSLDLITDFAKLVIYTTFFFILLTFYGIPIHIMRDLFITARSFIKRLTAFLRYRQATHDMNTRYADATVEDLQREDTCIICREEMRPWAAEGGAAQAPNQAGAQGRPAAPRNERQRPKKLPCGHILHLGCLKSWLERQQVCPTCRRAVVENRTAAPRPQQHGQPAAEANNAAAPHGANPQGQGMRMINLGPLRFGFGQAPLRDFNQAFGGEAAQGIAGNPRVFGLGFGLRNNRAAQAPAPAQAPPATTQSAGSGDASDYCQQLEQIERSINDDIDHLQFHQEELQIVRRLREELDRLRTYGAASSATSDAAVQEPGAHTTVPNAAASFSNASNTQDGPSTSLPASRPATHTVQRLVGRPGTTVIPAGSDRLPPGVVIPEGWSLMPLARTEPMPIPPMAGAPTMGRAASASARVAPMANASSSPAVPGMGPSWPVGSTPPGGVLRPMAVSTSFGSVPAGPSTAATSDSGSMDEGAPASSTSTVPGSTLLEASARIQSHHTSNAPASRPGQSGESSATSTAVDAGMLSASESGGVGERGGEGPGASGMVRHRSADAATARRGDEETRRLTTVEDAND